MTPAAPHRDRAAPSFGAWAALYHRYRPRYPARVYELLGELSPSHGLCVELGAGSGQATGDLLGLFERVIALEPDRQMADRLPAHSRLSVRIERAERVLLPAAAADAVAAAASFHWMNQVRVARRAARWLAPSGVFFAFGYGAAQYPGAAAGVVRVLSDYGRRWRGFVPARLSSWRPYVAALKESGAYASAEAFEIYAEHDWTAAEVAGFLLSTTYGAAFALSTGDSESAREEFQSALLEASGGDSIRIRLPIEGAYGRTAHTS